MGDRSHIVIQSESAVPVVLYGHWTGSRNLATVQQAESIGARMIGDPAYLAATLFHLFSNHPNSGYANDPTVSYGIWAQEDVRPIMLDEDYPTVYVNADTGEYRLGEPWDI